MPSAVASSAPVGAPVPVEAPIARVTGTVESRQAESAPAEESVDISDVAWPDGERPVLLIVEDDRTFAGMLAELARETGFDAVITPSGRAALALAGNVNPPPSPWISAYPTWRAGLFWMSSNTILRPDTYRWTSFPVQRMSLVVAGWAPSIR